MNLDERALSDLGFQEIRRALAARCQTEPGRDHAAQRPFLAGASAVHDALRLVEEARTLLAEPLHLPLSGITEIRQELLRAQKGAMLEPRELIAVTHVLFAFERLRQTLDERRAALPGLFAIARRLPPLERLATRLERSFEPGGELADRASPALKEARDRARGLHASIKQRLDKLLRDEKFTVSLREPYFSVRNDRYVVPVLAQARAEVPGIVHNASQSGQTLFVEPQALIGLGNDLAIAQSLVLEEERRILQELSHAVGREAEAIGEGLLAAVLLDEASAAARLAADLDAVAPSVELEGGPLELLSLRHPLLVLKGTQVVENDVSLSDPVRAMVISGPNAGGKTVTLTGVGLCALMVRAGLPIPVASGSRVPLFTAVHTALGDSQDLEQGLSTFSAHVSKLARIGRALTPDALVLVDEIAADTDPREGAALAIAVLEDFISRSARVVVTTHLEEVKAMAHLDKRFVNARVGFDQRRMAPTYRLQLGASGASSAIDVALRTGLDEAVCARARELVRGAGGPLSAALRALEQEQQALERVRAEASERASAAARREEELERERRALAQVKLEEERTYREGLAAELGFARQQIRELVEALKKRESAKAAEAAARELTSRLEEQERRLTEVRATALKGAKDAAPLELRVGARVHHAGMGRDLEILALEGDELVVGSGVLRLRARAAELSGPREVKSAPRFPSASASKDEQQKRAEAAAPRTLALGSPTCDVRGMRAEEAARSIDQFLDRLLREGTESALIIHGHGTGALKAAVRDHLEASPYVGAQRPGESAEGGDGVTVVALGAPRA